MGLLGVWDYADDVDVGERRNILLIVTTGQRGDALGGAGVWPIDTPQLDALAIAGLAVTAVSPSPADRPALASLYTGLHPRQHGLLNGRSPRGGVGGWAQRFREAGYHLAGVGRVGLIADQLHAAHVVADLDEVEPLRCEYLRYVQRRGMLDYVLEARQRRQRGGLFDPSVGFAEPSNDVDGYIGELARGVIVELPSDRPWLMVVAFTGPGNDLAAPEPYLDLVDAEALRGSFVPATMRKVDAYTELRYPRALLQAVTGAQAAAMRQHYLARVCMLDFMVGRSRKAMTKHGHDLGAWTVLTSNRGEVLGERGLFGCTGFVGSGPYVPMWVAPPTSVGEIDANNEKLRDRDGLVSGVDLAATLCAIGQVDPPAGCLGRSILPGLVGETVGHDAVISEFGKRLLLETAQHKAMFDAESGKVRALFDVFIDEAEQHNLVGDPKGAAVVDMLRWRLAELLLPMQPVVG